MNRTKRTLLSAALLVAPAAVAEPPSARFPGDGFELRVYQDAEQAIPPSIFSIPGDGRHPDPPPGGAFRSSCNVFLVIEGDRRVLVDAGNGAPRGSLLAKLRADGVDPATITDVLLTHEHRDHVGGLVGPDGAAAFPSATLHALVPPGADPAPLRPDLYGLRAFADPAAATNLPAGFVAEPGPGHTPCHVFYRKGTLLFLCGAHIPFPGIVSKIHLPMASAHEAPSFDTPDPGTPIPAEPRPPEPPEPLIEIRRRAEPAGVEAAPPPSVAFPAGPSGE